MSKLFQTNIESRFETKLNIFCILSIPLTLSPPPPSLPHSVQRSIESCLINYVNFKCRFYFYSNELIQRKLKIWMLWCLSNLLILLSSSTSTWLMAHKYNIICNNNHNNKKILKSIKRWTTRQSTDWIILYEWASVSDARRSLTKNPHPFINWR